jgi:hypothetical protein
MSAIVQTGALGTATLALMTVVTLTRDLTLRPPHRALVFAVLLMMTLRSVLESGLFDATAAFIPFLCFALSAQRPQLPEEP